MRLIDGSDLDGGQCNGLVSPLQVIRESKSHGRVLFYCSGNSKEGERDRLGKISRREPNDTQIHGL